MGFLFALGLGFFGENWDFGIFWNLGLHFLSVKRKTGVAAVLQLSLVVYTLEKLRLILSFCHLIVHLSLVLLNLPRDWLSAKGLKLRCLIHRLRLYSL